MLERWRGASAWVLGVGTGAFFGAVMAVFGIVQGEPWPLAAIGGVVAGGIFGGFMGPWAARQRRQAQEAVGEGASLSATARGLRRHGGAAETDDDRAAVIALARHRLQVLERQRVWGTALFAVFSVLAVWLAVVSSPWWWLEVVFFAVMIALAARQRRRLRHIVAGS